jgi:ethanolamine ammonia-lyase small subunit
MAHDPDNEALSSDGLGDWPEIVRRVRARTPARLLAGRSGAAYRTHTQLELRSAHAAARDAVREELDLARDFGAKFIGRWKLFEVSTLARSKDEYLLRPDLGRSFNASARRELNKQVSPGSDLQIAIGDGLSVTAVAKQVPALLNLLHKHCRERGWKLGQPFVIRHCRVGIINEIGELLRPRIVVLLIGERPGLATAESLSAYLAYRPERNHTDANRNLISNIHARGVSIADAAVRIVNLSAKMMQEGTSGYQLREELPDRTENLQNPPNRIAK